MRVKCSAWGASIGLRLPASIVEEMDVKAGDFFNLEYAGPREIVMWPEKDDAPKVSATVVESDAEQFKRLTPQQRDKLLMTPPPGW